MANTILTIIGTRPEAIKMAPVIQALHNHGEFDIDVCLTAQHREMLDQVLELFGIEAQYDLDLMTPGQSLSGFTSVAMAHLEPVFDKARPSMVLVQGDTTTAFVAALSAYYHHVPVAHVEAGLRTHQPYSPWPEELNRKLIGQIAELHFAPTAKARHNLVSEGIDPHNIQVTGNTVIDAVLKIKNKIEHDQELQQTLATRYPVMAPANTKKVLVTGHRRESFGQGIANVCQAIRELAINHDVRFIYPVHLNPNINDPVYQYLGGIDNIELCGPLPYLDFVYLMDRADIILTDSGGVQEEAPSLGKPVLVTRERSERQEALNAGTVELVGRNTNNIVDKIANLFNDNDLYHQMSRQHNPYGDGSAAQRIVQGINDYESSNG